MIYHAGYGSINSMCIINILLSVGDKEGGDKRGEEKN